MRRYTFLFIMLCAASFASAQSMKEQLLALEGVESVEQIAGGKFLEKYVVNFRQLRNPIGNPADTSTFLQRVIVGHIDIDSLVVLHTHGYNAADHKQRITVRDELSEIFNSNDIWIEHRYFGTSCPADTNWNEVTTANAAYDAHRIIQALRTVYKNKWISTGGSKDGITSVLLSMYYPQDIDVAVPYVAPFCLTTADKRGIKFMQTVGTESKRERIRNWQLEALKRRDVLQPMVKHYADSLSMRFSVPFDMIYDYCILDYDFGVWMRGVEEDSIPLRNADNQTMYRHFLKYANPDMFDRANMHHQTYYVQSAKELGNYAYDFQPFKKLLSASTLKTKDYLKPLYLPEGGDWDFTYSDSTRCRVIDFLKTTDRYLLFVYGETDAWTAFAIDDPAAKTLNNPDHIKKYVLPGGCHYSKINEFEEPVRDEIIAWIREKLH